MNIRKAHIRDIPAIQELINVYASQGLMLPRSLNSLCEGLRDFLVVEEAGKIVGVGALHILWTDLAEIRSLAIAPERVKNGLGLKIVRALLEEARQLGIEKVFTLTYQPGFFEKCGFHRVPKDALPQKAWKECFDCVKFPNCDEVPLLIELKDIQPNQTG
ncbi:N-acetyltransferase [Calderihabitans maritimus]|uniref:Acetyltransferase n=1 Tax=Calderihabitans maritimus TaxID=1246530 RepID=A0A1Z5HXY6_9FIRM|nr:N-acetyltransferase [Calderihabitans maritimus]GAW94393.1 acetyltransferase [Calderihabitans maritimus]